MKDAAYILACDIGTTAIKTCLFLVDDKIKLIESAGEGYPLTVLESGGAEQNPDDWWHAMCVTTEKVLKKAKISPNQVAGISFCSQMQGLVLVDRDGVPVRPAMSYMDQRAREELKKGFGFGPTVSGCNIFRLLKSLYITKTVSASVKDPVWKYKWVEANEPENFKRVYKWLDVKEYLILKCTGRFIMTKDSAFATMLYDPRKDRECFSESMCEMFGVNSKHFPEIIRASEEAGKLSMKAAKELGLKEGTPVFGGGGDASLIGVGAGAVKLGSTHIYCGTSGWVSTVEDHMLTDINAMIGTTVGADEGHYNYFAELETAGKCLEWVKDHLALDEIDIYLEKKRVSESQEVIYASLYDYMMYVINKIPAGSNGVIFAPWLHGNRCPFEDANARGMFFNIGLDTGKTELIRSVLEGICYHMRWMLEAEEKKVKTSKVIRFVGGGALSPIACQTLSDVIGRKVETVENPQNVGAVGAALVAAVGLGKISNIEEAESFISISGTYFPNAGNKKTYDRLFEIFKELYYANRKNLAQINCEN